MKRCFERLSFNQSSAESGLTYNGKQKQRKREARWLQDEEEGLHLVDVVVFLSHFNLIYLLIIS